MGYQESYVTTKKKEDFAALCEYIRSVGKDYYNGYGAMPVDIIREQNGQQWIYFVGERYIQSNKARILGFMADDDDFNSEEKKLAMWDWLEKVRVVFTEEKSPEGIWKDAGKPVTATHEEFLFEERKEDSMSKVYFVVEARYGQESIRSDELYSIGDPDSGENVFEDIFKITECQEFAKSPQINEFVGCIYQMAEEYFKSEGQFGSICVVAIDKETKIFQWGINISKHDAENLQFTLVDWKKDGKVFKYKAE